jgi:hypothetical protein
MVGEVLQELIRVTLRALLWAFVFVDVLALVFIVVSLWM